MVKCAFQVVFEPFIRCFEVVFRMHDTGRHGNGQIVTVEAEVLVRCDNTSAEEIVSRQ